MKKAIRTLILFLAVTLLAVSCNKTAVNEIFVSGKWELVHIHYFETTNYNEPIETYRPGEVNLATYYVFQNGGQLEVTNVDKKSGMEDSVIRGSWTVDGKTLIVNLAGEAKQYNINTANLTDLILDRNYKKLGKEIYEVTTFKKF